VLHEKLSWLLRGCAARWDLYTRSHHHDGFLLIDISDRLPRDLRGQAGSNLDTSRSVCDRDARMLLSFQRPGDLCTHVPSERPSGLRRPRTGEPKANEEV